MRFRWGYWRMQWTIEKGALLGAMAMMLASCGMVDGRREGAGLPPAPVAGPTTGGMVADFPIKIGNPYQIGGTTYTPVDAPNYEAVGYASWYGEEMGGGLTANGERFNPSAISAAHKTLPLPSYVEVTALDTGRTILARVNDRGPFANDRVLDLSRGAAEQLGVAGRGAVPVRVRRVNPPEQERAALRSGQRTAERLETPPTLLAVLRKRLADQPRPAMVAPNPSAKQAAVKPAIAPGVLPTPLPSRMPPVAPSPTPRPAGTDPFIIEQEGAPAPRAPAAMARAVQGGYVVQVAAFSSRERAEAAARRIGANAHLLGDLWRVRYGPYPSEAAARAGVERAAASGFPDARIMVNE